VCVCACERIDDKARVFAFVFNDDLLTLTIRRKVVFFV
jgi:hypothetical protein